MHVHNFPCDTFSFWGQESITFFSYRFGKDGVEQNGAFKKQKRLLAILIIGLIVNMTFLRANAVLIGNVPNDKNIDKQLYLQQIKAPLGWEEVNTSEVTIAILDTGVDLYHPDLKANLVEGINLIDKKMPPQDDNGHGTNVAGIVGAIGNNDEGIAGLVWNAKIMPIKVLDEQGEGDSFLVGQGIRYAVDNGAKIVLLSLGEPIYTPFMKEAVDYAESKDVLVVAASGNEGNRLNYPSAFANVLSVGAVDLEDDYETYSNYGQQLDVVAPGEGIYTTKLGGGYTSNVGTSMAAPQVAGLAALIYQKYPILTPAEVRDLIKFTADDVGRPGWDILTGYGRINVAKALTSPLSTIKDGYEQNQTKDKATPIPLQDTINAQIAGVNDHDWYQLLLPYRGKVQLNIQLKQEPNVALQLELEPANSEDQQPLVYPINKNLTIDIDLPKGTTYLKISLSTTVKEMTPDRETINEQLRNEAISYSVSTKYTIYKDNYENNDRPWQAYQIQHLSEPIKGTLEKDQDLDWYKLYIPSNGELKAKVSVDTLRLDPVIRIQPEGKKAIEIDSYGSGKAEEGTIFARPGTYYIQISDYNGYGVNGEYTLQLQFKDMDGDIHEPNNLSSNATRITPSNRKMEGILSNDQDVDWFIFEIKQMSNQLDFDFLAEQEADVTLYDDNYEIIWNQKQTSWKEQLELKKELIDFE